MVFSPKEIILSVQSGWMSVVLIHSIMSQGHHATKNKAVTGLATKEHRPLKK